jgi:hypothetical protein
MNSHPVQVARVRTRLRRALSVGAVLLAFAPGLAAQNGTRCG